MGTVQEKSRWPVLLAASMLFATAVVAPAGIAGDALQELDEVEVTGKSLRRMYARMVELEDQFNALYNRLNDNDDFDVHCFNEAPLGTLIRRRVCRVAYVEDAQADRGQSFVAALQSGDTRRGLDAPPSEAVGQAREEEYRRNLLKVINGDPRLQRLARERLALQQRYLELLRKKSGR